VYFLKEEDMLDVINLRNRHKALLSKWWWIIIRSFLLLFAFANMGNESCVMWEAQEFL